MQLINFFSGDKYYATPAQSYFYFLLVLLTIVTIHLQVTILNVFLVKFLVYFY